MRETRPVQTVKMVRKHDNVYDAMLAGFMKLILVICIGALTLSKFAGFEWYVASDRAVELVPACS